LRDNFEKIINHWRLLLFPFLLYTIFFLLSLTYNPYHDQNSNFINKIQSDGDEPFKQELEKTGITDPERFSILNPNYYYLFGKLYHQQSGLDTFSFYMLQMAVEKSTLFDEMAFLYFTRALLLEERIDEALIIASHYPASIPESERGFWAALQDNSTLITDNPIPGNIYYFPLITRTILKQKHLLSQPEVTERLHEYFSSCGTDRSTWIFTGSTGTTFISW
jgi:hypothetical protein